MKMGTFALLDRYEDYRVRKIKNDAMCLPILVGVRCHYGNMMVIYWMKNTLVEHWELKTYFLLPGLRFITTL